MYSFLEDFASLPALVAAVDENLREWTRFKGILPGVELHDDGDVVWTFSTRPGRGGAVAVPRFTAESADRRIAEVLAPSKRHGLPALWWVGPSSSPGDLDRSLDAHGLVCQQEMAGMAVDLYRLRVDFPAPPGLTVTSLEESVRLSGNVHPFLGPTRTARGRNLLEGVLLMVESRPRRMWHFLAWLDGAPVGSATVFLGAGVAGLYHVGTVPAARGRGIGKAVTLAALGQARDLGCRIAILHSSRQGEGMYRQLGFSEVGRVSHWEYSRSRILRERWR